MNRRRFLKYGGWLTAGVLLGGPTLGKSLLTGSLVRGRVRNGKIGISGVVVSDGFTVVATDAKGRFEFAPHPKAKHIFISTPSGYAFLHERQVARHYREINTGRNHRGFDFQLKPLPRSDEEHRFIIWADPQVKNAKDVEKMMTQSVPDVQALVSAAGPGELFHGITVGDIVWDELQLFQDYEEAVAKMGIPFFQCLGNHDMDYNQGGDENSDRTFKERFGPTAYSFNRGQVHYVVMDDVRYLGKDRNYDGYISEDQLNWLKKDLSFVSQDKLIVLCVHIPVHSGVKNNQALYDILGGRTVHIMSGHTHYHLNVERENIYEHNHGTVCGAWWTGPICGDGTPCGYGVYEVKGKELSWLYKSTGELADHQMKLYVSSGAGGKQALLNVWDHDSAWKVEYQLDGGVPRLMMQQEGFDPDAYATLLGPELPKPRGFAEPRKTSHLFRADIPDGVAQVTVSVTDRFGRQYQKTQKV